jgi:hypothetical protein
MRVVSWIGCASASARVGDGVRLAFAVNSLGQGRRRRAVGLRGEFAVDVAGADAQLEHHRRAARLGEREAMLDRGDDRLQVRARVEQPQLRLHREGVGALLHDAGALAVVLADDHQRAALHPTRRQVRQRVGGDVGADRRLPGHGAAQRGGRLRGARLEVHAPLVEDALLLGVAEDVHQVGDRRALVATDVGDAGLQQRLGDGEDALATEGLASAGAQVLDLLRERSLGHGSPWNACAKVAARRACPHVGRLGDTGH